MHRRRRRSGVSMIELIIAVAVLVLGMIALMSSVISSSKLSDQSKETVIAYEAARAKIEEIRNYSKCGTFGNIFTYYNNPAFGQSTVTGLTAYTRGGYTAPVLEVIFPKDATGNLSEAPVTPADPLDATPPSLATKFGMPKDLNRDGSTASIGINTTYKLLPVMIRVRWESIGKKLGQVEVVTMITEK